MYKHLHTRVSPVLMNKMCIIKCAPDNTMLLREAAKKRAQQPPNFPRFFQSFKKQYFFLVAKLLPPSPLLVAGPLREDRFFAASLIVVEMYEIGIKKTNLDGKRNRCMFKNNKKRNITSYMGKPEKNDRFLRLPLVNTTGRLASLTNQ